MARTPSLTPEEAIAAIGTPRGQLFVTSANKPLVRKWATSMGLPGKYAATLANAQLAGCYNGSARNGGNDRLDWHKEQAAKSGITGDDESEESTDTVSDGSFDGMSNEAMQSTVDAIKGRKAEFAATNGHAAVTSNGHDTTDDKANQLARLLLDITNRPQGVDAAAVSAIVEAKWAELPELIAKYSPITTIEVKGTDGETRKVEGHQHPKFKTLLRCMSSRMANGFHPNIMIVGPTGSGKTHAVGQGAAAMGLEFRSNGAISMDHQLIGYRDANGTYHETPFSEAFKAPCVYLFDEMDSSDNSPLLALAGALANGHFDFPHGRIARHVDCVIVGAGNTWGLGATSDFVGRNKLDGAIRSRFPIRIKWEIDESLERNICGNVDWACRVQKARHKAIAAGLKVIIDPRMSQAGAGLIADGFTFDEAAELTYLADLSADQRKIVES